MHVSIAMATYNGAQYIEEQLQSFAHQTLLPMEVVITDDGSTDATLDIAERFATTAPFAVHIHRNVQRLGYNRNFELTASKCKGDLIFFSDQDDVWFPDKLASVVSRFNADERVMLVINGQIITDADLDHSTTTMLDNLRSVGISPDQLCSGCATAFRKQWGELVFPMPEEIDRQVGTGLDRWINELAVFLDVRYLVERPLQYFRRHGANTTESLHHSPKRVGLGELISTRVKQAPVSAWQRRSEVLELYERWLTANRSSIEAFGIASLDGAFARIAHEKVGLTDRSRLTQLPLHRRPRLIWKLWWSGGYRYFHGWRSMLRDLTRGLS